MSTRFHKSFQRHKTAGSGPAFGTDTVPGDTTGRPTAAMDNVLNASFNTVDGWPAQRIAVVCQATYTSPPGTPTLVGNLYFFEELTQTWHLLNASPVTITPNGPPAYFDIVCVPLQTPVGSSLGIPGNGSISVMLIVTDTGGATSGGTYTFAMAPDTTSSP
jgi:hypothetical protein